MRRIWQLHLPVNRFQGRVLDCDLHAPAPQPVRAQTRRDRLRKRHQSDADILQGAQVALISQRIADRFDFILLPCRLDRVAVKSVRIRIKHKAVLTKARFKRLFIKRGQIADGLNAKP